MPLRKRKYPIGAEILPDGVHFRVWAPDHKKVELILEKTNSKSFKSLPMKKERDGFFSLQTKQAQEGSLYRYRCSNSHTLYSDPASHYQPFGPEGPSCVINSHFPWTDSRWKGISPYNQIAYEMHIGTFTEEGTFKAAADNLSYLADLGITLIEIMPLAEFPGHFGWGYDGVNLFSPFHLYGHPNDLKAFIDKAHSLNIGVVLDVVYNHLGPAGSHLVNFSKEYLSSKHATDWGKAVNFDSTYSKQFFLTNAIYWIQEYHFDGLRIDATPWFFCSSPVHILQELTQAIKTAGGKRKTIVIGENESQDTKLLRSYEKGGYGFDILWNDDFHHSTYVRLTGMREAYCSDYLGSIQELISSLKYGFLYQGQYYEWQKKPRGTPDLEIPRNAMMVFLENHDQIANSGSGSRLHQKSDPGIFRALTALFLLGPNTPLIFQGQEFNSSKPFCYFADHASNLSFLIKEGRKVELSQFPRLATSEAADKLPEPENPLTFIRCKLDHSERVKNKDFLLFFKDLIQLKKTDPVLKEAYKTKMDAAHLGKDAFVIRYFNKVHGDRLLIINLGIDLHLNPCPEPLIVAALGQKFEVVWSSEFICYGRNGVPPLGDPYWKILGHSAVLLKSVNMDKA